MAGLRTNSVSMRDLQSPLSPFAQYVDSLDESKAGNLNPGDPTHAGMLNQIVSAIKSGDLDSERVAKIARMNKNAAPVFLSALGEAERTRQEKGMYSQYFQPEQTAQPESTMTLNVPGGTMEQVLPGREAAPAKMDYANAIAAANQRGDIATAQALIKQQTDIAGGGKASEAKLIQVDTQDDKGNKVTELRNPYNGDLVKTVKGSPKLLSDTHVGKLQTVSDTFDRVEGLSATFDDRYGGFGSKTLGDATQSYRKRFGDDAPFVQWWQTYQEDNNIIRKELFGSALTVTEKAEFDKARINPGMSSVQIRANLERQRAAALRAAQKLSKPFTTQNFDRRMVVDSLGRHAEKILSTDAKTTEEVLKDTEKQKDSAASRSVWTDDKEKRYQELLRKRNAQ